MSLSEIPRAWVFVEADALPESWRDRAKPAFMLPLMGDEVERVLGQREAISELDRETVHLLTLIARGLSNYEIAKRTGISERSVQRRVIRFQEKYQMASKADLAAHLVSRGFG